MPIYEYQCNACHTDFEYLIRGSETAACPNCAGVDLNKKMSLTASPAAARPSLPVCNPRPAGGT